ncbi:MAG: FAD-dependent oxidoreductase [Methanomicrobiales archaeon]|nr:FAD-dependent oxidoreductase [Methanomicrobiales archaeon]
MPDVRVYTTKQCPYCRMVKAYLERRKMPFSEINVSEDREAAGELIRISGQNGVPVTVAGDRVIVGFDAQALNEVFGGEEPVDVYDVIILGAGPAGLAAAVYTTRKLVKTLVITENIGGQALESWAIENYMGYRMVTGEDLMKKFEEQARELHIQVELDGVVSLSRDGSSFTVKTATDRSFGAKCLIIATGKHPKMLGLSGEERFIGRGLSICATCDGPVFKGKNVGVVGGGNSALQTAIEMSKIAKNVHLVVRSQIRADKVYQDIYRTRENIITHLNVEVSRLLGDQFLTGLGLRHRDTGEEANIEVDGVFLEIGWLPNTEFLEGFVTMNPVKEIVVDENCHTSVPGVFAAGDVTSIKGKQIIIAAGEGAKAALEAYEYLVRTGQG